MTARQHQRISDLFMTLSDLPSSERIAALDAACAGDSDLRLGVLRLLQADEMAANEGFLARTGLEDAAELMICDGTQLPASGTVLGNYRLGSRIGAGGMGVVYEAQDLSLNRRVALKILPPMFAGVRQERILRFQREARAAAQLTHPHIAAVYGAGDDKGWPYIAMEFVEGRTLRALIADKNARPDFKLVLDILGQTASALSAAHEAGIIHRDIKPENIMLRPDGFAKVLDFGLASVRDSLADPAEAENLRSRPGQLAGTVQYLSPEQVLGKVADARSDLFSLGVVGYELSTGVRPFDGPTDGAIFDAILNQNPKPASAVRPEFGNELDDFLRHALEKDRDLRFQTAKDLRSSVLRLARDSNERGLFRRPVRRPHLGNRSKLIVASSAAALAAAILVWNFMPPRWSQKQPLPTTFEQLTDAPGEENSPSFTPDGKEFIYASPRDGNWDIYLQRTGGSASENLTRESKENNTQPSLSPDGSKIAYRSERDGGGLFVMESTGENPRRIANQGYFPAWSPDNGHVVYSSHTFTSPQALPAPSSKLRVIDVNGGEERELNTGDATQPSWSPHGLRIAYFGISDGGRRDIFTVAADGKSDPIAVTSDAPLDWYPVWAPSGDQLYFLSDRGGTMNIWRVAINERSGRTLGHPEPVTVASPYVDSLAISSDGKSLIYSMASRRTDMGSIAFDPVRQVTVGNAMPLADGHTVADFRFSPDGSQIAYDTIGDTSEDLWIMNADGSGRRRLTLDKHRNRSPEWSPKGDQILFFSDRSGNYENWTIGADGSGLRQLTNNPQLSMQGGVWSPDGKHYPGGTLWQRAGTESVCAGA